MLKNHSDEVYVVPFRFKYLPLLLEMHESRNNALNTELTMQDLPKIGYIALLGKSPVAAGFLRRVEPNHCQLDTFLSNPYFGSKVRHLGMSLVTLALISDAKDLDLRMILAITMDKSIMERAKHEGFQIVEQNILAKRLK